MDGLESSVYNEAKAEYTRQLCVFLVPSLESYFLELLQTAKDQAPSSTKVLWQFQTLLQGIPDWNQDKVIRETDKIQSDCKCDYLEELLTAVFIAHTKVLSAIRLTTKQKKLQITIPKLDHFLHRVLSECARSLWTNAFLFTETTSIEKQKNLRQVSSLLQDAVLQGIRGMLPVKSILREYLHDDDEDEKSNSTSNVVTENTIPESLPITENVVNNEQEVNKEQDIQKEVEQEVNKEVEQEVNKEVEQDVQKEVEQEVNKEVEQEDNKEKEGEAPVINIDTKPSVSFSQGHVFFDSDDLESNEIQDIPFAEAELKEDDEDDEDDDEYEDYIDTLKITDEILPMDAEVLE